MQRLGNQLFSRSSFAQNQNRRRTFCIQPSHLKNTPHQLRRADQTFNRRRVINMFKGQFAIRHMIYMEKGKPRPSISIRNQLNAKP